VIRICSKCGALLLDDTESCSFCEVSAAENQEVLEPVAALQSAAAGSGRTGAAREALDNSEPEWRVEVSRRLQQYRARRGRLRPDDSQSGLPFREASTTLDLEDDARQRQLAQRQKQNARKAAAKNERVEIRIQPQLDFTAAPGERARPQNALVPVASLAERRWAGAIDAIFLAFTCLGFVGLFRSLGGEIALERMDAIVCATVVYLFYGAYISLFTTLAGSTPGMQLRGLTIVRLDGSLPDTRQLLWRSFGYLLSAATLLLGFLWALWDEDRFTWQDRISQTYITAAAPLSAFDTLDFHAHSH
jgi:uncharacterized RDD family membrane protein YckC